MTGQRIYQFNYFNLLLIIIIIIIHIYYYIFENNRYTGYLTNIFEALKAQGGVKHDAASVTEARDFIKSFQQAPRRIRGPFLAEIDLEARLVEVIFLYDIIPKNIK